MKMKKEYQVPFIEIIEIEEDIITFSNTGEVNFEELSGAKIYEEDS